VTCDVVCVTIEVCDESSRALHWQSMVITMADGSTLPLDGAALKEALQYR
jgi:hypothetical protein